MTDLCNLRRWTGPILVAMLAGLTLFLRIWNLNGVPPWLWWDEATQGLDVRSLLAGQFRVFFPSAMGKEPFYIYMSVPFVAAWDGAPAAVRITGALIGALMIPTLYSAARSLWFRRPMLGMWAGLAAAGFWATNFWPQSINRIGFQVNTFPLLLALAVIAWLNYTRRPTRQRALVFGALAGLTLMTYIVARITPLLWALLYAALPYSHRRALRPTLPWALLCGGLVIAPLVLHFAFHPTDFFSRVGGIETLQTDIRQRTFSEYWFSLRQLIGGFLGLYGDPILRHNIPDRPPFSPIVGMLFAIGTLLTLGITIRRRDQGAITLLLWWFVPVIPFLASATNAPHFPRLIGALPPALLLAAGPIGWLADQMKHRLAVLLALASLLALLLAYEGVRMGQDYFGGWAHHFDHYRAFQGDTWTFGARVAETPGAIGVTPLKPGYGAQLDYLFPRTPIHQFPSGEADVANWLAGRLNQASGKKVLTPVWTEGANTTADLEGLIPFYLSREGMLLEEQEFRDFRLLIFQLDSQPQFAAVGRETTRTIAFPPDLTLIGARWGAAAPNLDRNSSTAAAGTRLWVILTWQLARPLRDVRVSVDLVDDSGHRLDSSEMSLVDAGQIARPANSATSPGILLKTYHLPMIPKTQPAGPIYLEVRAYNVHTLEPILAGEGEKHVSVMLDMATVTSPLTAIDVTALRIARPQRHKFASGIELLGLDEWPPTINAGQTCTLKLYWYTSSYYSTAPKFSIRLGDTTVSTAVTPAATTPGQVIHSYADLRLPPDVPGGAYELQLMSVDDGTAVMLGAISVTNRPRQFNPPTLDLSYEATFGEVVQLLGLNVLPVVTRDPAGQTTLSIAAGQPVTLVLAWHVVGTPTRDLKRFVHVLGADGRPVAQEDSTPCSGACPAMSWLVGEILVEQVRLVIPVDLAVGTYPLAVGWYDAKTFQRLPGRSNISLAQAPFMDMIILPLKITITR